MKMLIHKKHITFFITSLNLEYTCFYGVLKMAKNMCSWDKDDIKENEEAFRKIVKKPKYFCKKCGRVAKDDDLLCKPKKL
ncbi:MAG: hypothetical protein PWQ63_1350 [Methanolobus sp.]|nr:hypothetical protein [Methanolobus sp.]